MFKLLLLLLFFFFFGKGLDDSGELAASALKGGDNVAGGRLQQGDDVGDELFPGLDGCKFFELVSAYKCALLYVSTFEFGLPVKFLSNFLDKFRRGVGNLRKHDGRIALEDRKQLVELAVVHTLDDMGEEGVLH